MLKIAIRINLKKIDQSRLVAGKLKENGKKPMYVNCHLRRNQQSHDAHFNVYQSISKEEREAEGRSPFLGTAFFDLFDPSYPPGFMPQLPVVDALITFSFDAFNIKEPRKTIVSSKS